MPTERASFKRPESVLVVVHARTGEVLLLKRADHPNFWQSVTGAMQWSETDPRDTAVRELAEEIGLAVEPGALRDLGLVHRYAILPQWRHRYAPGVTENTEHAFALEIPEPLPVVHHPEHTAYRWLAPAAAAALATSWTNRIAIERVAHAGRSA